MPTLRVLTVDLTSLNLETSAINGAKVEISVERTATFDSYVITPTLNYKATSDSTGILTFNILPNDSNTAYRAVITDAMGEQILSGVFTMPDANANLADLIDLSYYPDGFNPGSVTTSSTIQFKSNNVNLGTPLNVRNFNVLSTGLFTYNSGTMTVTLDLQSIQDAVAGKQASLPSGTSSQYLRGDLTMQTLNTGAVPEVTDKRYVTDAQRAVIANTSGINTGDETATSIRAEIGAASNSNDGYLSAADWSTFNGKQAALGFTPENSANKDTDGTLATNSDTRYPSQKAVKTYSDAPRSTAWRIVDGSDPTKKISFSASAISAGTTRNITMPDRDVDLGKIYTGEASVVGGVLQQKTVDGTTYKVSIQQQNASSVFGGATLIAGQTFCLSPSWTSGTLYLPASPADGDTVWIEDAQVYSGVSTTWGFGHSCIINGNGNYVYFGTNSSYELLEGGITNWPDFHVMFRYSAADSLWKAFAQKRGYKDTLSDPMFYRSGTTSKVQLACTNLTSSRTIFAADFDINLMYYKSLPVINSYNSNTQPTGTAAAIVGGAANKANKANQVVITGQSINADGLCPEDSALFGIRGTTYSSALVTGVIGALKGQSSGTANADLVTGSNTKLPAYLTKPSGHHAVAMIEARITMTTTAGKVWLGVRRISVRYDGSTVTVYTQTLGSDDNPDSQTVSLTASVSSGLLSLQMANASASGGDICLWQCTYTANYNGG